MAHATLVDLPPRGRCHGDRGQHGPGPRGGADVGDPRPMPELRALEPRVRQVLHVVQQADLTDGAAFSESI